MSNRIKVHPEHKKRMKQLYKVGFTVEELMIAFKAPRDVINNITQGITPNERI